MNEIINSIYSGLVKGYKDSTDISILSGTSGKILFLSYLYNSTREKAVKKHLEDIIEHTLDLIISNHANQPNLTYGGGVTGFYWVINHIYENRILFKDSAMVKDIITQETDDLIAESLQIDFQNSKYDPLYGYIGKGIYFISKRENRFTRRVTGDILNALTRDRVIVDSKRTTWIDVRRKFEEHLVDNERLVLADCGQAHGVTGIISFLCNVVEKFESTSIKRQAVDLLGPAVEWLSAQEIPHELRGGKFMFPPSKNLLDKDVKIQKGGRLGWCYGDNIIAYALYKASAILGEERFHRKADEIIFNSCKVGVEHAGVLDRDSKKIFDPTICHGSAGIACIYQAVTKYNQSPLVVEALHSWKELTKDHTKSYLESKLLISLFNDGEEAFDFLYGYSGIGLHLISDIYENRGWESCIMID